MSTTWDKGLEIFRGVYGDEMADGVGHYVNSSAFGSEQARWAMEWAFGTVWTRDGLERKMRSCAVLGMLIGRGQADEIRFHTKMGLANGLTRKEIEEIFYTSVPYCGLPASNVAKEAMLQVFAELDAEQPSS